MALNVVTGGEISAKPALVMMPFLGGSTHVWDEVVALLGPAYRTLRIDLPGFGGSAGETGYTIAEMADAVAAAITEQAPASYVLVGHSMAGKVSAVLARRAADAQDARLKGVVLVAPSPPGPEPMTEQKRGSMIANLGGAPAAEDFKRATSYVTKNETRDLSKAVEERTAHEVLRMNRTAWVAWLTHGSKEDWAGRVGVLDLPCVILAGEKDASLGPDPQTEKTLPHFSHGRVITVKGSSHLIPLERPEEMAQTLREFLAALPAPPAEVPQEYLEFLHSERVSQTTRTVLEGRMAGPAAAPGLFTAEQEATLRAVMARVIPQQGPGAVDLAGTVMARLATGKGDGWRYAVLPEDLQAYRQGLDKLGKDHFSSLPPTEQDRLLEKLAAHKGSADAAWFEEVRGDATNAYMGHPATLARLGYSGIGVGGAFTPFRGFIDVGVNSRETWEPLPVLPAESKA